MTESPCHRSGPDAAPSPASDHTSLPLPLADVTVVSLEQAVAAPFATCQLADLGARVIKIERPDGGDFASRYDESVHGQSSYFGWLNRSKHSLTLDVKPPTGARCWRSCWPARTCWCRILAPAPPSPFCAPTASSKPPPLAAHRPAPPIRTLREHPQ